MDTALAKVLDHTRLDPGATVDDIDRLCDEAASFGFHAVCVNGVHVARAAHRLDGSGVVVAATVGFPLGANAPATKTDEARRALDDGARELDMVVQVGALLAGDEARVLADLSGVIEEAHGRRSSDPFLGPLVKVILETALLDTARKVRGAELARVAGADFVKTSTGFGPGGATVEDVALLARTVAPTLGVKAAGGIRTAADARRLLAAGATRLGASASVAIVSEPNG